MPDTFISDIDLAKALKEGSESAFEAIYDRYWHKMYRVTLSRIKISENSEEIVQEIFSDLWARRAEVDIAALDHYLFRAVKFKVLDFFKRQIVRRNYEQFVLVNESDINWDTEQELAYYDLNQAIIACIDQLPVKTKLIFELSKMQQKSNIEIADLLKISNRAVEYHLSQGLKSLRLQLKDYILMLCILVSSFKP